MIIQPKIRGFICTTAHPDGCAAHVQEQIDFVKSQDPVTDGPKKVLVIGSSTGYGLSSRIMASFGGSQAATIGIIFEKESDGRRTASAGWYNTAAFEEKAQAEGIYARSFNADAYSDETKQAVLKAIKDDLGKVDTVIYSLAAPRRQHPKTGEIAKSVLKPIKGSYTNKSIDLSANKLETVTLPEATTEEVAQTVSVMGGEDWEMWIDALIEEDLLEEGAMTVAYSYVGPEITQGVYRNGTIGKAKDHLEETSKKLDDKLKEKGGRAFISVNKALVTQSSSAIPFIPLYYILLNKVMIDKKIDEDTIHQIYRLFTSALYSGSDAPVDDSGFIRMDDLELRDDVQSEVNTNWDKLTDENLRELSDLDGYHKDFLKLFGFGLSGVDYDADVDPSRPIPSINNPSEVA